MSINDQRLTRRVEDLYASDAQFAAASPNEAITQAIDQPGVALPQLIRMVMEGYADRPALGQRALRFVTDPDSGRTMVELLPRFETITYRELWARAGTLATALSAEPAIRPGDRVCVLGFNSVDYTTIDIALIRLGAVSVPLQTSAPVTGLRPIVTETEPTMIATSIDNLGDAVEVLAGHAPARLVVFDYHGKVDTHREAVEAARARLAGSVTIDTLAELIERGRALPATPIADSADDALALLIYTSGSTGAPKGAMYRESQVMSFVPRIWDMVFAEFHSEVDRRLVDGADRAALEAQVKAELRENVLGGRFVMALTGSAPISAEMTAWVESLLADVHLVEGYGSTEAGMVLNDGMVRRPAVIDYKLVDVPELGYFGTDQPYPRGELLVKTQTMFPGYYQRPDVTAEVFDPDGFYRTGDIMAKVGPDQFVYLDRRNNVLKLSQGEFIAVSKLEAVFGDSPLVRQIFIYGNSARAYPLAVVVPSGDALSRHGIENLKPVISESLQEVARAAGLQSYEIPRDFIIETTPFTLENGLLTGIRKLARPQLKKFYGERLERLYTELADSQSNELRELRQSGPDAPVLPTLCRAAAALLGSTAADVRPDAHFADLGGDSLSALSLANLLHEIFGVDVPVGVIVSPASDLRALADHIEAARTGVRRPSFASIHGRSATEVHASDLTLDKFIDAATLAAAPNLPAPSAQVRTVLLTGATGFLGRYLALEWLDRMDLVNGKLICLVRARSDEEAQARLDATFDSGDPYLVRHYRELGAGRLEVLAGDKGEADLGLDRVTWQRLADTVDLIVDPAALVNHVLPYSQLFGPNAAGTAELLRLALTGKRKPYIYTSTIAVGEQIPPEAFTEDADIRAISPTRRIDDSYANGYANSKWAGEVLLREAHEQCGLPVTVFRCDMILADTSYTGQLNLPDMFTRLMLSLAATGIAPGSFYELDAHGNRQRAHYDGLPVEFVAEAICTLGTHSPDRFVTYHVMNPYDDGIGLDEFVDWLNSPTSGSGCTIQRIADYGEWLQRFETSLRALPDRQRHASLLPLLHNYREPAKPICGSIAPTDQFRAAVQEAKIGPDKDIPHLTAAIIAKYISNLRLLGLL